MAAVLHAPQATYRPGGILLNPSPRSSRIIPLPSLPSSSRTSPIPHPSSSNSLSSASSSNDEDLSSSSDMAQSNNITPLSTIGRQSRSGSMSAPNTRRIRFAPLPDPRRESFEPEDGALGDGLPLVDDLNQLASPPWVPADKESPAMTTTTTYSRSPSVSPRVFVRDLPDVEPPRLQSDLKLPLASTDEGFTPTSVQAGSTSTLPSAPAQSQSAPTSPVVTPRKQSFTKKLFKPLFNPMSKANFNISFPNVSAEDVFTLGTKNLFRSSSRDSRFGDGPEWGVPLARVQSGGSTRSCSAVAGSSKSSAGGVPLGRTQSLSAAEERLAVANAEPTRGRTKPRSSSTSSGTGGGGGNQPIRMLNGRVYGGRRRNPNANKNLFATARDEPEFVEWGYGGMGSVKAAEVGNRTWEKLQSGSSVFGSKRGGAGADEEDDGSGMGWVKRRRDQREREKKEKEERERGEKNGDTKEREVPSRTGTPGIKVHTPDEQVSVVQEEAKDGMVASPVSEQKEVAEEVEKPKAAEPEHVYSTVSLPAHLHHHHLHRSGSHDKPSSPQGVDAMQAIHAANKAEEDRTESPVEDEADEEDEEEADVSDEEEEFEEDEETRKTVQSAGVEKVSRHKEKEQQG